MEGYIGQIVVFSGNFAPEYWALCDGRVLPINNNEALYSIIGTTYGGNGTTTFALPNLCGRTPVGKGLGVGLEQRHLGGQNGGDKHIFPVSTENTAGKTFSLQNTPTLGLNYIICTDGIYPSRS